MLQGLFGSHLNNLQTALDRTSRRQALLMTNLANVNVPGYKRQDLDFRIRLEGEMRGPTRAAEEETAARGSSIRLDGNNVDLEREVMSIAETDLRFQALSDMTANYFAGLKNVIKEGR